MRSTLVHAVIAVALVGSSAVQAQDYSVAPGRFPTPEQSYQDYRAAMMATTNWSGDAPAPVKSTAFEVAPETQVPMYREPTTPMGNELAYPTGYYPSTYVLADALYWHRVGTGCDDVLVINTSQPTGADTVLRTSDLHFNGTGGFRFLVGWRPDPACCPLCCAWELSYWGIFGWNADQTATSNAGDLAIPGDLGLASNNFFLTNILNVNYQSQLNNIELNCIKSCCLCCGNQIDFLCGFRYINLNETLTITGTDFQEGTSNYNVHTDNNLFGFQFGGRYTRQLSDLWSLQLVGKSGLFWNDVHQSQAATDFPDATAPFSLRDRIGARGSAVAGLGEMDFVFMRRLNDVWSLRLGYTVIGIGGLALAPDQLDFNDTFTSGSGLQSNGWMLVHGGLAGLQARW